MGGVCPPIIFISADDFYKSTTRNEGLIYLVLLSFLSAYNYDIFNRPK